MRFIPILLLVACSKGSADKPADQDLLVSWMQGTFTSEEQAKKDPKSFLAIRLVMERIWSDRTDGTWFYVEQASFNNLAKPYRQRVYHVVEQEDGAFRSEVYTLPGNPLDHAGRWTIPGVKRGDLKLREGCAIHLRRDKDGAFRGSTKGKLCSSRLGKAKYATSEVTIIKGLLTSWDRGWDGADKQAWGATKGAYKFVRVSTTHP